MRMLLREGEGHRDSAVEATATPTDPSDTDPADDASEMQREPADRDAA